MSDAKSWIKANKISGNALCCGLTVPLHFCCQHRCHKAEQTKNNSTSTRLHPIPRAFFAGRKRDADVKRVHGAENNLLFLPLWWLWRTSDCITQISYAPKALDRSLAAYLRCDLKANVFVYSCDCRAYLWKRLRTYAVFIALIFIKRTF